MPISNFLSGNSIVDSMSSGVRDQGYLYTLQRQLRAEDQRYLFDQQANPLRLDSLRADIYKSQLDNQFTAATQQQRVDQFAAQTVILGAKARYADTNERAGAITSLQTVALNDQVLQSQGITVEEQRQDFRIKYPALAATFGQQRVNITDAGGKLAPDQGLPGVLTEASAAADRAVAGEGVPLPGGVRSYAAMLYDSGSPVPATARPASTRADLEAGLGSLSRQLQDFDEKGPMYRQYVATFGPEAAAAQHGALRAASDATDTSLRAMTAMGEGVQRAQNAVVTQETENVRLRRENEELKLSLSRATGAAAPAPVAAAPTSAPVAAPGTRADPLARPGSPAAPVAAPVAAAPVAAASAPDAAPFTAPANPTYTPPLAVRGQPLTRGVIYADPNRENPVIDLGALVVNEDSPAGFDFSEERDPPTVVEYQTSEDGATLPVLAGNASHVFKAMLTQESGNRQLDRSGRPITSSAGATGIAQVMPATAREQARVMGIPWDERRYKYDAGYNLRLGQGYFERMLRTFDGDTVLAAAAYNGGPGMVNRALRRLGDPRKGRISHAAWAAGLPSVQGGTTETRDYVRIVHGRAARAGKGK